MKKLLIFLFALISFCSYGQLQTINNGESGGSVRTKLNAMFTELYGDVASLGTVSSVSVTVPAFLSVSGSPITTSGTFVITLSGTALPAANGGTGLTSLGSALQVLRVNGAGTALEYADPLASGVESVTGDGVDNTDPANPVLEIYPTAWNDTTLHVVTSLFSDNSFRKRRMSSLPFWKLAGKFTLTGNVFPNGGGFNYESSNYAIWGVNATGGSYINSDDGYVTFRGAEAAIGAGFIVLENGTSTNYSKEQIKNEVGLSYSADNPFSIVESIMDSTSFRLRYDRTVTNLTHKNKGSLSVTYDSLDFISKTYAVDSSKIHIEPGFIDFRTTGDVLVNGVAIGSGSGTVTGSGTTNEISYWTSSTAQGALAVATYPSLTELARVKGLTSAVQTQLDAKPDLTASANEITKYSSGDLVATGLIVPSAGTLQTTGGVDITLDPDDDFIVTSGDAVSVSSPGNWSLSGASALLTYSSLNVDVSGSFDLGGTISLSDGLTQTDTSRWIVTSLNTGGALRKIDKRKFLINQLTPSTAGGTITLNFSSVQQSVFTGSASFATAKDVAFSNTTNSVTFAFTFEVTNVAAVMTWPTSVLMADVNWDGDDWTPPSTGKFKAVGTFDGTNWFVSISGAFQ